MRATLALAMTGLLFLAGCTSPSRSAFLREGRDLYTDSGCSSCHGGRGQGGTGPALDRVATVFPDCAGQVEWVRLGSRRYAEEIGPVYGATDEAIDAEMPPFGERLTDAELRTVVAYERIELAGLEEQAVRSDCGV